MGDVVGHEGSIDDGLQHGMVPSQMALMQAAGVKDVSINNSGNARAPPVEHRLLTQHLSHMSHSQFFC